MTHIQEDALERYLLHNSPVAEREAIEEHLLVCEECQQSLSEADSCAWRIDKIMHRSKNSLLLVAP
jgi:hypothetical protein